MDSDIISMGKSVHHFKIKIFFSCFFSSYTPCIRRRITPWIERLDSLSHSTMNNIYHDCCWEDSKRSESSFYFKYARTLLMKKSKHESLLCMWMNISRKYFLKIFAHANFTKYRYPVNGYPKKLHLFMGKWLN